MGVVITATITGAILYYLGAIDGSSALIIGIVLSATDPVSVLAILKEFGLGGRVRLLVESESLFNDGVAAVLFVLALSIIEGSVTGQEIVSFSAVAIFGGIAVGGVIGYLSLKLAGTTKDHLVEITVTSIAAFGSFIIAEHFHASGVLATLTAGLLLGNLGHLGALSERGREAVVSFWEYAGFVANSLIFLLIGISLPAHHFSGMGAIVFWTILASLVGRAVSVYLGCLPFARTKLSVPMLTQHLLFWGGLRGALALALVLGLDADFPHREMIVTAVFYAVAFSIVVQGLTVGTLMRKIRAAEA